MTVAQNIDDCIMYQSKTKLLISSDIETRKESPVDLFITLPQNKTKYRTIIIKKYMTSFIANTFAVISHQPQTIAAVLATSHEIINSSIVPVVLSFDEVWDKICSAPFGKENQKNFLLLFSTFSDTMQFTEKLRFPKPIDEEVANNVIIKNLIDNKRYFSRTIRHLDLGEDLTTVSHSNTIPKLLNVKTLGVQHCRTSIEDRHLEIISSNFPHLEKLDLSNNSRITDDNGFRFISRLANLQELNLIRTNVSKLLSFLTKLPSLRILNLRWCNKLNDSSFDFDSTTITTAQTEEKEPTTTFSPLLPSLLEVDLQCCDDITHVSLQRLQKHAPNLTSLSVSELKKYEAFVAISQMKNLRTLILYDCDPALNEEAIKVIVTNLYYLEVLSIESADRINDEALRCISTVGSSPIRELRLASTPNFTDEGFACLTSLSSLESLEIVLNDNPFFTGDIGEHLCFPESLCEVVFLQCDSITDAGLKSVLKNLPSLKKLQVDFSLMPVQTKLTCEGLHAALNGTSSSSKASLRELNLSYCNFDGVRDLRFLEGLTSLEKLDLSGVQLDFREMMTNQQGFNKLCSPVLSELILTYTDIEEEDVLQFPEMLTKSLRILDLNCCMKLTEKTLVEGVVEMPLLEILRFDNRTDTYTADDLEVVCGKLSRLKSIEISSVIAKQIIENKDMMRKLGHSLENYH